MKIKYSPEGWDDHPVEITLDDYIDHKCVEHPIDTGGLLKLLHSKNLITDEELLNLIGAPYAELIKQ